MHIAFVIDLLAFEGLGTTLTSLVRNCRDTEKLTLHFICSDVNSKHKNNILNLLKTEEFRGETEFHDFDAPKTFGHLNPLHGSWTPYGKFLIPEVIKADYALYFDADLLILLDVLSLQDVTFNDTFLAAAPRGPFKNALDGKFLIEKLGVDAEQRCFNSGVMLFNLKVWREKNIGQDVQALASKFPMEFPSHDQTILNALAAGNYHFLEGRFNYIWTPGETTPAQTDNVIFHFAGSPKPWDFLGKTIHAGHKIWIDYDTNFWDATYKKLTFAKLHRTWKIRRSVAKYYMRKFRTPKVPAPVSAN
jgi:lipopolysaccharide biosynthesis glycosyltransferase